jgi:hypothetical protein
MIKHHILRMMKILIQKQANHTSTHRYVEVQKVIADKRDQVQYHK